jgi:hypothetical protein
VPFRNLTSGAKTWNGACSVIGNSNGDMDSEARKQHFIVLAQSQQSHGKRLSPKNKGVSPYVSLQAGYRGNKIKKQGLTHMWLRAPL